MRPRTTEVWGRRKALVLELFVLSNLAFLILDIYLAHSVNRFRHPGEWIPFWFSIAASVLLVPGVLALARGRAPRFVRGLGFLVGLASVAVGIWGLIYHLESQFFQLWTVRSLVYTAPFVAPLSYAGLGFLLLLNRQVDRSSIEWGQWVVFLALGGFVGNFVLALADHAQNGFFHPTEWIPVGASALAVGFLSLALFDRSRGFLRMALAVVLLQVPIGLAGLALHFAASTEAISSSLFENFVHGAPLLAPMLFADIALLAAIGLFDGLVHAEAEGAREWHPIERGST